MVNTIFSSCSNSVNVEAVGSTPLSFEMSNYNSPQLTSTGTSTSISSWSNLTDAGRVFAKSGYSSSTVFILLLVKRKRLGAWTPVYKSLWNWNSLYSYTFKLNWCANTFSTFKLRSARAAAKSGSSVLIATTKWKIIRCRRPTNWCLPARSVGRFSERMYLPLRNAMNTAHSKFLRLMQLWQSLLRCCRYQVGQVIIVMLHCVYNYTPNYRRNSGGSQSTIVLLVFCYIDYDPRYFSRTGLPVRR